MSQLLINLPEREEAMQPCLYTMCTIAPKREKQERPRGCGRPMKGKNAFRRARGRLHGASRTEELFGKYEEFR